MAARVYWRERKGRELASRYYRVQRSRGKKIERGRKGYDDGERENGIIFQSVGRKCQEGWRGRRGTGALMSSTVLLP